ncbi:hypothetical protein [Parabacteroides faecis]|uniref:hypothetical protein n=1 Tax=Parabacteroides faecis TaxID=1217282 RepID=UPI003522A459
MKKRFTLENIVTLLTSIGILSFSCQNRCDPDKLLKNLHDSYPSSALMLSAMDSILDSDALSPQDKAILCYNNCELRDSLHLSMLPDSLLSEYMSYYIYHPDNYYYPRLLYYQGRAFAESEKLSNAINNYLRAIDLLKSNSDANLSAYIYSYMADLYENNLDQKKAREYYVKAAELFLKTNNWRSYIIAIRDQGDTYVLEEEYETALQLYFTADSLLEGSSDSILCSDLACHIGIVYLTKEDYTEARRYFEESLEFNPTNSSASFSLSNICVTKDDYDRSRKRLLTVLEETNDLTERSMLLYRLYEIDKSYGNYQSALAFLERSDAYQDSIVENRYDRQLVETEKKYQKQKTELANMRLSIERNRIIIVSGILIVLLVLSILVYQLEVNKRKRKHAELLRETEKHKYLLKEQRLLNERQEQELHLKEKELVQTQRLSDLIKETLFRDSVLYRKIRLVSEISLQHRSKKNSYQHAIEEIFGEPSFSQSDKERLKTFTNNIYSHFTDKLLHHIPSLSEEELIYCSLLMFDLPLNDQAIILNVTVNTIKSKRHRIMTKGKCTNRNMRLEDFLKEIQKTVWPEEDRDME